MLLHFYLSYIQPHLTQVAKSTNIKRNQAGLGSKKKIEKTKKRMSHAGYKRKRHIKVEWLVYMRGQTEHTN